MEGDTHQEQKDVEENPCDKNNNQIEEADLKKLPKSEEKETNRDKETETVTEENTEQDGEETICADEKDQPQTESQEAKGDCEQDRPGGDGKTDNNIAESEAETTSADNTDCNKETQDKTKTEEQKEGKSSNTEEQNTDAAPNKTEKKKSSKGKDGDVKSDVKKKGKTEEAEKPAKTQRKPGLSSSALSGRPRTSARSSRASAKNDIIAKFQQGAPETPVPRNFKIQRSATAGATGATIKQKILQWCISKTRKYEGVTIENFSSSWCDGMAFCALIHRFFPDAFDFASLDPKEREKNFTLAFQTAETLADCCPLLDVSDMLLMGKHPDPMCVFTYVQSLCHSLSKIEKQRKDKDEKEKADKKEGEEPQQETEEPEVDSGAAETSNESQVSIESNMEACDKEEDVSTRAETDREPLVGEVS